MCRKTISTRTRIRGCLFAGALVCLLLASRASVAGTTASEDMRDLYYYGNSLYYAYQGEWFEAIVRFDAHAAQARDLDRSADSVFSVTGRVVGDFELNYRMHQRAGRALWALIEGPVSEPVRNDALFRLARMYLQKDQPERRCMPWSSSRGKFRLRYGPIWLFCVLI